MTKIVPHYVGHRQRLKNRVLLESAKNFADYEILELLLFTLIPRKDVKPLAKKLISVFHNFNNIITAEKDQLLIILGINENIYINFHIIKEVIVRMLKHQVVNKNIINSWATLIDYLQVSIANLRVEQFRVLFLNKKNCLISDEILGNGTIDQAPVYPREIVKRALFHEAGAIILVYNHPSGSCKPSNSDIELTKTIVNSCASVNISVHDHIIIVAGNYFSFKSNMLL